MPEVNEIAPEAIGNYIWGKIIIPHGYTVAQGSVRHRKRDGEEILLVETIVIPFLILELIKWNLRMGA